VLKMGGVTVTIPEPTKHLAEQPFTIDDLERLPDDGMRYEIFEGSLLVSPRPGVGHFGAAAELSYCLRRQAPPDLLAGQEGGVLIKAGASYLVPDVMVVRRQVIRTDARAFSPPDVLLVAEVLSPSNSSTDLMLKRHHYATAGIPRYWIVDPPNQTLTVLRLVGKAYVEDAVVKPGQPYTTDEPFTLSVDPADLF
jgi:Uma2 family endonuclease